MEGEMLPSECERDKRISSYLEVKTGWVWWGLWVQKVFDGGEKLF